MNLGLIVAQLLFGFLDLGRDVRMLSESIIVTRWVGKINARSDVAFKDRMLVIGEGEKDSKLTQHRE